MIPIVEPEILNKGEHSIDRALRVHEEMLSVLFRALNEHRVYLEGMILKPAMVLPGLTSAAKCTPQVSEGSRSLISMFSFFFFFFIK